MYTSKHKHPEYNRGSFWLDKKIFQSELWGRDAKEVDGLHCLAAKQNSK